MHIEDEKMSNIKQKIKDSKLNIEEYRLRVISPIISIAHSSLDNKKDINQMITQVALSESKSVRTIKRWYLAYKDKGLTGLKPKYKAHRTDVRLYVQFDELLKRAMAMRQLHATISVNEIIRCLESENPSIKGILKRSTLQRHLASKGCSRKELLLEQSRSSLPFFGAYRKTIPMEQVQGDIKIPGKNFCINELGFSIIPYVHIWMDNASRMILVISVSDTQDNNLVLSSFKELVTKYGIPKSILTDQGSVYRSIAMEQCTYALGVKHKRSKPYQPQSKGALERLNYTLDGLLKQFESMENIKLSMFEAIIKQWACDYNSRPHSALSYINEIGETVQVSPKDYFEKYKKQMPIPDSNILNSAFTLSCVRKVTKDGVVSLNGKNYKIPAGFAKASQKVCLEYSTVGNVVRLVKELNDKEQQATGRIYDFIDLFEREIKENIDFKDRIKEVESDKYPPNTTKESVPPTVARLSRDIEKNNGSYINEEKFLQKLKEQLAYIDNSRSKVAQESLYSKTNSITKEEK